MSGEQSIEYIVYLPESGHPLAGIAPVECADIEQVNDSLGGTIGFSSAISYESNKAVEIKRFREFAPSDLTIVVPESIATELRDMRDGDCMIGVQRRRFCDNVLDHVHHYGYVTIDSLVINNAVSSGLNTRPLFPSKSVPAIFGLYQFYDRTGPVIHDVGLKKPIQVVFCDNPCCSACLGASDGCQVAYVLVQPDSGQMQVLKLETDRSNVINESVFRTLDRMTTVHCHNGDVLIAFDSLGLEPNIQINIDGNPLDIVVSTVAGDISPLPVVTHFASSGNIIYAAWINEDGRRGIDRSIDGGVTWDTLSDSFSPSPFGAFVDMAFSGSVLIVIDSQNVYRIRNNGNNAGPGAVFPTLPILSQISSPDTDVDLQAIAVAIPDFQKPDCPLIYVVDAESKIFSRTFGEDWEQIFNSEDFCKEEPPVVLETSIDGFGLWMSRPMRTNGKIVTLKNVGRGTDCDWMQFDYSQHYEIDCDIEVTVLTCAPTGDPNIFTVTGTDDFPIGNVLVCLSDSSNIAGYVTPGNLMNPGEFMLRIFSDDIFDCTDILSVNCLSIFDYPCLSWHCSAFAMCPSDPNRSLLVVGTTCPVVGKDDFILVKEFDQEGNPTEIISKGDECIPNVGCD